MDPNAVAHVRAFQVEALERGAAEVLRLVRIVKNSLLPVNWIPPPKSSHLSRTTIAKKMTWTKA